MYVAAHPDDENTRLLSYLANEKNFRTAYLSLTRGDGGQNLIGDEQGIRLGIIRTHELFAARRIDGAEQFFSRAYDFGYSKSPEETLNIWGHEEILEDVVKIIRSFKPDIIITRFPTTGEGGHGHHTASAILAGEAFDVAADGNRFKEAGAAWKTKALYWNAFNFGSTNTTRPDQIQTDIGQYNNLLGKSYGEMASQSRSQHKSQGFGVPMQRGRNIEYFKPVKGDTVANLFDLQTRLPSGFAEEVDKIIKGYDPLKPYESLPALVSLRKQFGSRVDAHKKKDLDDLIFNASGIYIDAMADKHLNALGGKLNLKYDVVNRNGLPLTNIEFNLLYSSKKLSAATPNITASVYDSIAIDKPEMISNEPWLPIVAKGRFAGTGYDADNIESVPLQASVRFDLYGETFERKMPVVFKVVDPVEGERLKPVILTYPLTILPGDDILLIGREKTDHKTSLRLVANTDIDEQVTVNTTGALQEKIFEGLFKLKAGEGLSLPFSINAARLKSNSIGFEVLLKRSKASVSDAAVAIKYDHIPEAYYHYPAQIKIIQADVKTGGKSAAYIAGAGDKIVPALQLLGYHVTTLNEQDITAGILKAFDVVVAGVRAYNVHSWLRAKHDILMDYVHNGGTYLVQYNTNNQLGNLNFSIGPYPFVISRMRITDENAKPGFLMPSHDLLNYPNKITEKDFEGWEQERSVYQADKVDKAYDMPLSFADAGEAISSGSLLSANYGKGRFIYTGLVFFRQLPAAVPGAYRLFANLLAKRK